MATNIEFREALRNQFLSESSITDLVGQQIFFQSLYSLYRDDGTFSNPGGVPAGTSPFPMITMFNREGLHIVHCLQQFDLVVGGHSDRTQDQAIQIIDAVREIFKNTIITGFCTIRALRTTVTSYDRDIRVYNAFHTFRINRIGLS